MTESEVEELTAERHHRSTVHDPRFADDDIAKIVEAFGTELPREFIAFRRLLPIYNITGDHLPTALTPCGTRRHYAPTATVNATTGKMLRKFVGNSKRR